MTAIGLAASALEDAVRAVRPGRVDDDPSAVFAAGAWTSLAEPGDGVAGALVQTLGAADALEAVALGLPPGPQKELLDGFERWRLRLDPLVLQRSFRNAAHLGVRLLVPGDPEWPESLAALRAHAPIALWVRSAAATVPDLQRSVALVGARESTKYGEQVAIDAAAGLVDRGFAIVSGAAYGIDGTAHRSALRSGGLTAAVLAGGLDRFYPSGHEDLLRRIVEQGVVLSELPCGASPTRWRFLQRNRLIAALSRATVVLEAGMRSGSLNTAGHAATLARPLGAVPGSVYSAASAGCHRLLREYDAVAVRDAADMAELAADPRESVPLDGLDLADDPLERRVLDVLGRTPRSALDVARRAGISPGEARSALGLLALSGVVLEGPGGWSRGGRPV
jgi:DNA processing protein